MFFVLEFPCGTAGDGDDRSGVSNVADIEHISRPKLLGAHCRPSWRAKPARQFTR